MGEGVNVDSPFYLGTKLSLFSLCEGCYGLSPAVLPETSDRHDKWGVPTSFPGHFPWLGRNFPANPQAKGNALGTRYMKTLKVMTNRMFNVELGRHIPKCKMLEIAFERLPI